MCYRAGFPEGHNRYSLSRLVRFQRDTILVAEDRKRIVGVLIGITSCREAWLTGLSVLPEQQYRFRRCSMQLLKALGRRLIELGFKEAFATTGRKSVSWLARAVGASLVAEEKNFYFDGRPRWIYRATPATMPKLQRLLTAR